MFCYVCCLGKYTFSLSVRVCVCVYTYTHIHISDHILNSDLYKI
jgi:hypothetical protein